MKTIKAGCPELGGPPRLEASIVGTSRTERNQRVHELVDVGSKSDPGSPVWSRMGVHRSYHSPAPPPG